MADLSTDEARRALSRIELQALGRERLAAEIDRCLSTKPGDMLSRPLLHDDDWRMILASLRAKTAGGDRDPRVDTQVWTAAQSLGPQQAAQPEWLWFADEKWLTTFGRWGTHPEQAPYVRADLALGSRSLPLDPSPQGEGGGA